MLIARSPDISSPGVVGRQISSLLSLCGSLLRDSHIAMHCIVDLGKHVSFSTGPKSFILPLFSICVISCILLEHRHCILLSCGSSRQLSTFRHTWQALLVQVPAPLCFCGQARPQLRIWYQCLECL